MMKNETTEGNKPFKMDNGLWCSPLYPRGLTEEQMNRTEMVLDTARIESEVLAELCLSSDCSISFMNQDDIDMLLWWEEQILAQHCLDSIKKVDLVNMHHYDVLFLIVQVFRDFLTHARIRGGLEHPAYKSNAFVMKKEPTESDPLCPQKNFTSYDIGVVAGGLMCINAALKEREVNTDDDSIIGEILKEIRGHAGKNRRGPSGLRNEEYHFGLDFCLNAIIGKVETRM